MNCSLHNVIEEIQGIKLYPYRCSRCKKCFVCEHKQIGYAYWICSDGFKKPATFDIGVKV